MSTRGWFNLTVSPTLTFHVTISASTSPSPTSGSKKISSLNFQIPSLGPPRQGFDPRRDGTPLQFEWADKERDNRSPVHPAHAVSRSIAHSVLQRSLNQSTPCAAPL